jgi:small conductance mechanosensitive channel
LGDSAVNITTRSWVNAGDYWGVYFDLMENAKLAMDANNISIPYPQTDVHLHSTS